MAAKPLISLANSELGLKSEKPCGNKYLGVCSRFVPDPPPPTPQRGLAGPLYIRIVIHKLTRKNPAKYNLWLSAPGDLSIF